MKVTSKIASVVTAADVDAEQGFEDGFVQIWRWMFGHKAKFLLGLQAQGLDRILKLKFR